MPVKFNEYDLGSMQTPWNMGVDRSVIKQRPPKVKGSRTKGMGGGSRQWNFDTLQEFSTTLAAIQWAKGLESTIGHGEHDLAITTNGSTETFSSMVCEAYRVTNEGALTIRISWTFSGSEGTMGTF